MPAKVSLSILIHSHQPVGNFEHVIEDAFQKSYRPFLDVLTRHPKIRLSLHYSGSLLLWLEAHHPDFIDQLRDLTRRGQIEHVGGGFYEPILVAIADPDKVTQIRRQAEFLYDRFGVQARGVWVTERVWEQGLISPLAEAGAQYAVLDDTHFLAAGLSLPALRQAYLTEESGARLILVPSLQSLRYTIPFREPEETLSILRDGLDRSSSLFAVGDDCEKFGVWPGTYKHCYADGWLERFFAALEGSADWLEAVTLSDYLEKHTPTGRVYLPAASYPEMMTWALPAEAIIEIEECIEETRLMPDGGRFRRFLRGGQWRNFLVKYPESNQMQKLALRAGRRLEGLRQAAPGTANCRVLDEALDHLLAAQCNDAYWHGIFGGLYAPHLRSGVLSRLIRAEQIMDGLERAKGSSGISLCIEDFDIDGRDEILLDHGCVSFVARPADGGTVSSLRFKPAAIDIINSLARRPEAYHRRIQQEGNHAPSVIPLASIHDRLPDGDGNLRAALRYDRYMRHSFRSYLFAGGKEWQDFDSLQLDECGEFAGGAWEVADLVQYTGSVQLRKSAEIGVREKRIVRAVKTFNTHADDLACTITCETALSGAIFGEAEPLSFGAEMVFNLLAPNSPDRYFVSGKSRHPLGFRGEFTESRLALVDERQHVEIALEAPGAAAWWVVPIETVSQSESGFERVYQGSAIMAVWDVGSASQASCVLRVQVASRP
ncbi:MAG: alpha-amylase/4-alpha-glucanotransferase domain-containing protein [Candidatus Acidiferrales bacterium]